MIGSDRDDMLVNPAEFITSKSVNPDSWQRVSSANPAIDSVTGDVYLQGLTFGSFHGQSTSVGSVNAFITRFRSNGTFVRTLFYGQPNPNSQRTVNPSKIMVYNSAIYVVGNVLHGTLFDLPSYVGNWDFYILKFTTSNDQIQFADGRVFGSGWNDFAFGFDIDPVSGIAMIAGRTDNKLYASYYYGGSDAFELRIPVNNLRNGDWKVSQFGSALGDGAYGIVFDQKYTKTFYITGIVSDNVYFDPNNQNKISIVRGADQFVASILPDGTRKWISMFRNTGSVEISRSIVVNPIDGNLYVLGGYVGTLDADLRAIQQSIFAGIDISLFVVRPTNGSVIRSRIAGMAWVNTKNQCDMAFSGAFLDNGTLLLGSYMGESAELLVYQGANFFKFYYNIFNSNMIEDASPKIPPPQMTETITSTVFVGLLTQTVTVTTTSARSTFYLVFNTTVYTSTPTVQGGCRTPIFETTCLFTPTKSCDEELLVAANDFNSVSSNFYFVVSMDFAVIIIVVNVIRLKNLHFKMIHWLP
jgi:hypothetical protein